MPLIWVEDERRQAPHGAGVAGAVQPVQDALGAPLSEEGRELSAGEAAAAFSIAFDRALARIRENHRIVESAHLVHGADGVLRPAEPSNKNRGERLGE